MHIKKYRKKLADECLLELMKVSPEKRAHAYQRWLCYAYDTEVRKHWRPWMGPFPSWATKENRRKK
jgi:hypothetical protein